MARDLIAESLHAAIINGDAMDTDKLKMLIEICYEVWGDAHKTGIEDAQRLINERFHGPVSEDRMVELLTDNPYKKYLT